MSARRATHPPTHPKTTALTGYTCEELPRKTLYVTARERRERVSLQEVKYTHPQQIRDDTWNTSSQLPIQTFSPESLTDVISVVETVPQVNALVPVLLVIARQSRQNPQLDF